MDMEVTAWNSLYTTMTAQEERRPISRATLRRIATFAQPHRRQLGWFLLLSVVTAALAVATPVLAGRVVDAIVAAAEPSVVVGLAVLIAVIAVARRCWWTTFSFSRRNVFMVPFQLNDTILYRQVLCTSPVSASSPATDPANGSTLFQNVDPIRQGGQNGCSVPTAGSTNLAFSA